MATTPTNYVGAGGSSAMSGTWSTLANAEGSAAGTCTTWESSAIGASGTWQGTGFGLRLPPGAMVNSISVSVGHYESSTSLIASVTGQVYVNDTAVGTPHAFTEDTSVRTDTWTADGTFTADDIPDLQVRVVSARAAATEPSTQYIDWAAVTVDYTAPVIAEPGALNPNPDFAVGIDGYHGYSTTLTYDSTQTYDGHNTMKMVATGSVNAYFSTPAAAGWDTLYRAYVRVFVQSGSVYCSLDFNDCRLKRTAEVFSATDSTAGSWQTLVVTAIAPPGTTGMAIHFYSPGAATVFVGRAYVWAVEAGGQVTAPAGKVTTEKVAVAVRPKTAVFRGPLGTDKQDLVQGKAGDGILAYEGFAGKRMHYVLDYMVDAPANWTDFTTCRLGTRAPYLSAWQDFDFDGRIMMLSLSPCAGRSTGSGGTTWAAEAAGTNDPYWTTLTDNIISHGLGNACIRLGREFNYNAWHWSPGVTGDSIAAYKAGYRHIVDLMRSRPGANFTFCWNPAMSAGTMQGKSGWQAETQNWYPGDDYVDVIGLDSYDYEQYQVLTAAPYTRVLSEQQHAFEHLRTAQDGIESWVRFAKDRGKPLCFPEWGDCLWLSGSGYYGGNDDPYFIGRWHEIFTRDLHYNYVPQPKTYQLGYGIATGTSIPMGNWMTGSGMSGITHPGDALFAIVLCPAAATISISDSQRNTWQQVSALSVPGVAHYVFAAYGARQLSCTGDTITATSSVSQAHAIAVFGICGRRPDSLDAPTTGNTGTSASPNVTTPAPGGNDVWELVIFFNNSSAGSGTPAGWWKIADNYTGTMRDSMFWRRAGQTSAITATGSYASPIPWGAVAIPFHMPAVTPQTIDLHSHAMWEWHGAGVFDTDSYPGRTFAAPNARAKFLELFGPAATVKLTAPAGLVETGAAEHVKAGAGLSPGLGSGVKSVQQPAQVIKAGAALAPGLGTGRVRLGHHHRGLPARLVSWLWERWRRWGPWSGRRGPHPSP